MAYRKFKTFAWDENSDRRDCLVVKEYWLIEWLIDGLILTVYHLGWDYISLICIISGQSVSKFTKTKLFPAKNQLL